MPEFIGKIRTEWLSDGESMVLIESCGFVDSKGLVWQAFEGDKINGASIPRFFWRVVGSPFRGYYRKASVFHDVACDKKTRTSKEAARMFYEAILLTIKEHNLSWLRKRLEFIRARFMYLAVLYFGPQWR